jgi:hypothetical protein
VLNQERNKIARADFRTFDIEALIQTPAPAPLFICNLPKNVNIHSIQNDLLSNTYVTFADFFRYTEGCFKSSSYAKCRCLL